MDFYQGPIATIHPISPRREKVAWSMVREARDARPGALLVPALFEEFSKPAMKSILSGLSKTDYLNEILFAVTAERPSQIAKVRRMMSQYDLPIRLLWCESPEVRGLVSELEEKGLDISHVKGKGYAVWLGLAAAGADNYAIAIHDADIEDYNPAYAALLLQPLVSREMDFYFSKGFYARVTDHALYGRVTRLFVWPFLDALTQVVSPGSRFLSYMRGFRYPLAGEVAVSSDLAQNLRISTDWGIEVSLLSEVFRNASPKRLSQVDLGVYSHKHQPVGAGRDEGLQRMVSDVATTVLRGLVETEGAEISDATIHALTVVYTRMGQDSVRKYFVDSRSNGLDYDRHGEELLVEKFSKLIGAAGERYLRDPYREQLPDLLRVYSAVPDFGDRLAVLAKPVGGTKR